MNWRHIIMRFCIIKKFVAFEILLDFPVTCGKTHFLLQKNDIHLQPIRIFKTVFKCKFSFSLTLIINRRAQNILIHQLKPILEYSYSQLFVKWCFAAPCSFSFYSFHIILRSNKDQKLHHNWLEKSYTDIFLIERMNSCF